MGFKILLVGLALMVIGATGAIFNLSIYISIVLLLVGFFTILLNNQLTY
jgi:hypothetical protein